MKNKLIKIACICLMLVSLSIIFTGCNKKQGQVTMMQIREVMEIAEIPYIEGCDTSSVIKPSWEVTTNTGIIVEWQEKLERYNIDTTNFMAMDSHYVYYYKKGFGSDQKYYIRIFKFSDEESSENCCKKLNKYKIEEKWTAKQYGNLTVYVDNEIALYVFKLINGIKSK